MVGVGSFVVPEAVRGFFQKPTNRIRRLAASIQWFFVAKPIFCCLRAERRRTALRYPGKNKGSYQKSCKMPRTLPWAKNGTSTTVTRKRPAPTSTVVQKKQKAKESRSNLGNEEESKSPKKVLSNNASKLYFISQESQFAHLDLSHDRFASVFFPSA